MVSLHYLTGCLVKSQFGLVRDGLSALFNRLFSEEPVRFSSRWSLCTI